MICDLFHPERIPAVNVSVETDHSYFLSPLVVAERPDPVRLLARLLEQRFDGLVAGNISFTNTFYQLVSDPPQGDAPVPGPRH